MNIRNCFFLNAYACGAILATACTGAVSCAPLSGEKLTVMEYNAQAFFDATETGSEFAEFRGGRTRWNAERYEVRLDRVRESILLAGAAAGMAGDRGPDIVVLAEIENETVIRDLCNRMPRNAGYAYAAFAPPGEGCAFGTALVSRYPVRSMTIHSVGETGAGLRPLIEAVIDASGSSVVIFAAHWKSKVGVATATVDIRSAQERLLLTRIRELEARDPDAFWIACGDFNQRLDEFGALGAFMNPWDDWLERYASGSVSGPPGSFWYDEQWETIDHFFLPRDPAVSSPKGFRYADFRVVASSPLLDVKSHPARYEVYSGVGYSDHLPLVLSLERGK